MLKNYLLISLRHLRKHKLDSAISIGGLAVGLACCFLLVMFVRFEWSYDQFHENSDRIYRVVQTTTNPSTNEVTYSLWSPLPMAAALESAFPEMEKVLRLMKGGAQVEIESKFSLQPILYADANFFQILSFPLIEGDPVAALADPDNVVLSKQMAERLFGSEDAIGETITIRFGAEDREFRVSGIAARVPDNSSITFDIVLPFYAHLFHSPLESRVESQQSWHTATGETYVLLHQNASAAHLPDKFRQFARTHYGQFAESRNMTFGLQPLNDIYFGQAVSSRVTEQSNILYSWILAVIALVVLAIACINYMTLTLSRASSRTNEIWIRKVMGAHRGQLGLQFLGEAFITCGLAFILAIVLAELFVPLFQQFIQKQVGLGLITDPVLWLVLSGLMFLAILITGGYPALVISRKKASGSFSSRTSAERIPGLVRGLIVIQFALSITFMAVAFIMQQQMKYVMNKDLGFSPSNVVQIELNIVPPEVAKLYAQELRRLPGIERVSGTIGRFGYGSGAMFSSINSEDFKGTLSIEVADEHFLETLGIVLVEGVDFSRERMSDIHEGMLVSARFVEMVGWENPVGRSIRDERGGPVDNRRVIGVFGDYHRQSLLYPQEPLVLIHPEGLGRSSLGSLLVRLEGDMVGQTLQQMAILWDELLPEETFAYSFLDDVVRQQYVEQQRWRRTMQAASAIAILIACFGLFGLAALAAQRRTREIGIRKVMGATVANIMTLLSRDFLKLVLIGFVIAVPISWYAMNRWLEDFAYRIEISWWVFAVAGGLALVIALLTVSTQAARAALSDPVKALRCE